VLYLYITYKIIKDIGEVRVIQLKRRHFYLLFRYLILSKLAALERCKRERKEGSEGKKKGENREKGSERGGNKVEGENSRNRG
jgi:hypothetical protein